ncbi:hypothetical protein ACFSO7_02770 [Bacillus sp. CGMCC 1.16607]|uniref:hypothetical protein n=1 Tax=Bacillus sp. CGMCC 1.16607 TaxID=3351842 RepID=UPI00362845C6
MNREEKRKTRLEICKLLDTECSKCEYRVNQGGAHTYCYTVCSVGIKMQSLASHLVCDETMKVLQQVTVERTENVKTGSWSHEEEFYLENHFPIFSVSHLANRLNRSQKSVAAKVFAIKREIPKLIG